MLDGEDGLRCAVAFWGPAMAARARQRRATVILDLSMRGTSRNALKAFGVRRIGMSGSVGERLRILDRLHAKVYLGRDAAIIGSANASVNALGRDGGKPALWEAGVLIDRTVDPEVYRKAEELWFDLLHASRAVRPEDLDMAPPVAATAASRDTGDTAESPSPSILDAVLRRPDDFASTVLVFGDHDVTPAERKAVDRDYAEVHGEAPESAGRSLICTNLGKGAHGDSLRTALHVAMLWFGSHPDIYAYHDLVPVEHNGIQSLYGKRSWPFVSREIGLRGVTKDEAWNADCDRARQMSKTLKQRKERRFVIMPAGTAFEWLERHDVSPNS